MIPAIGAGRLHLIGVCGTAMASLAGLLKERGLRVTGSDQAVYPPMSELLRELEVEVRSPYAPANVPEDTDLVVVGNAISRGNAELESVLERRLPYTSMPEVLKELFLRERTPVVVAGTHGKTTTTALVALLLESAGRAPGFLVGGLPLDFPRSFRVGEGEIFVVEGDEYDTAYFDKGPKFLHYLPQVAVMGNVEFDHADIYEDVRAVERAFRLFANLVPRTGLLVLGSDSERARAIGASAPCPVTTFGLTGDADWSLKTLEVTSSGTRIEIRRRGTAFTEARAPFWGEAGLRNVLAAAAVSEHLGLEGGELARGLSLFSGVRRRLEVRGSPGGVTVVDDFAHHPTAVRETLLAARKRWPSRKIWGVFEPRSYTARSRRFQKELSEALGFADEVLLAEVAHSARLPREEELSEEELVSDLRKGGTKAAFVPEPDAIVRELVAETGDGDVVLIMSNGSFGGLHGKLLDALTKD